MKQVTTAGIIYKIMNYSDRSAVSLAFSPEYGKMKLFIPKAFSSKGGFMTFVPGNITFDVKETSDLHRFVAFSHNPEYYHYTQIPEITMRMHLMYDIYDSLFHAGEKCTVLWQLSCKYNVDNYRKLGLYSVYRLLREAGVMFSTICGCGKMNGDIFFHDGQLFCESCPKERLSGKEMSLLLPQYIDLLQSFGDNDKFRQMEFSEDDEKMLFTLFNKHVDSVLGKANSLKSVKVFMSMLNN